MGHSEQSFFAISMALVRMVRSVKSSGKNTSGISSQGTGAFSLT